MRDQTAILNAGAHSDPLNELSQVLEAVAIRVALFLFRLACAYVALLRSSHSSDQKHRGEQSMMTDSVVRDVEEKMNAPKELLDECWLLVDQETMLDVAATMAATQPEITATPVKSYEAHSALSLHWSTRQPRMTRTV
jgi:hypothetical protein